MAIVLLFTGSVTAAIIILIMVISGHLLRFSQEFQSDKAAEKLREMVSNTATIKRKDSNQNTAPKSETKEVKGITVGQEIGMNLLIILTDENEIITRKDCWCLG